MAPHIIIISGVSGCGKSSVGALLAARLGCPFLEGDALHPQCNIDRMASGRPLTDADRLPWLLALHARIRAALEFEIGDRLVVACSALKPEYRHLLVHGCAVLEGDDASSAAASARRDAVAFVLLQPSAVELRARLEGRDREGGHFFRASLLDSQLDTLSFDESELFAHVLPDKHGAFPAPEAIVDRLLPLLAGGSGGSGGGGHELQRGPP